MNLVNSVNHRHHIVLVFAVAVWNIAVGAAPATDFERDIRPILAAHCHSCHGPDKQRGGLRLDQKVDALRGGDTGPLVAPGQSKESLLYSRVTTTDPDVRMPQRGKPLSAEQIKNIKTWIDQGAVWPEEAKGAVHWAFQPVRRPAMPALSRMDWPRNIIDHFVLARLEKAGLVPTPEAARTTLVRRLKFDLLGLPPTPQEIEEFVLDSSSDAYEKLVNRYLASPHYGERWARHWLDVVRFAESHGFDEAHGAMR